MKLREKTTAILLIAIIMISMMAFVSRATGAQDYPTITPDPTYGPPGTMVVIEGAHFIAMEMVTLEFWNEEMSVKYQDIGTPYTDSKGDFRFAFRVGPVDFGTYIIVATQDDYQITASIYFVVRTHESIEFQAIAKGSGELKKIVDGVESFQPFKGKLDISCSAELEWRGPPHWYDYYIPTDTLEVEGLISIKWTSEDGTKHNVRWFTLGLDLHPDWSLLKTLDNELYWIHIPLGEFLYTSKKGKVRQEVTDGYMDLWMGIGSGITVEFKFTVNDKEFEYHATWHLEDYHDIPKANVFKINSKLG